MKRKTNKPEQDVIVQSAVRVNLTLDFPVTEPDDFHRINALVKEGNIYDLINGEYYDNSKAKSKLVTLEKKINTDDVFAALGIDDDE